MNRPALAVLLACCLLLLCFSFTAAAQDGTAERSLNTTAVSPGETVEVTVTAELDEPVTIDFADTWSPDAGSSEILSTSFPTAGVRGAFADSVFLQSDGDVSAGTLEIVYRLSVPDDASPGTVYEWEPFEAGDGSVISVGEDNRGIGGVQQFEVVEDGGDGGSDDGGDGGDDGGDGGSDDGGDDGSDDGGDGGSNDGGDGGGDDGGDGRSDDGGDGGMNNESGDGSGPGFGFVAFALAATLMTAYWARRSE